MEKRKAAAHVLPARKKKAALAKPKGKRAESVQAARNRHHVLLTEMYNTAHIPLAVHQVSLTQAAFVRARGSESDNAPAQNGEIRNESALLDLIKDSSPSPEVQELADRDYNKAYSNYNPDKIHTLSTEDVEDFSSHTAAVWTQHARGILSIRSELFQTPFHKLPTELIAYLLTYHPRGTQERICREGHGDNVFVEGMREQTYQELTKKVFHRAKIKERLNFSTIFLEHANTYASLYLEYHSLKLSSELISQLKQAEALILFARSFTSDAEFHRDAEEKAIEDLATLFSRRYLQMENYYAAEHFTNGLSLGHLDTYYYDPISIIERSKPIAAWVFSSPHTRRRMQGIDNAVTELTRQKVEKEFPNTWEKTFAVAQEAKRRAQTRLARVRLARQLASGTAKLVNTTSTVVQIALGTPFKLW